jgi:hypothetical protein
VKISWVTIDRICQEEADAKENVRRELEHTGRPLRSSADSLSDDELLTKLRSVGLDVDRDGVERLCAGALSAEEVAASIVDKLKLGDEPTVDWVWISLLALWQRLWPDRPSLELLDDKIQAGYAQDAENDTHAAAVTWLNAWSVLQVVRRVRSAASSMPDRPFSRRKPGIVSDALVEVSDASVVVSRLASSSFTAVSWSRKPSSSYRCFIRS